MGYYAGPVSPPEDKTPEEMAEDMLKSELKPRQPEDVLRDMKGWFEWFDQLGTSIAWFEIPRSDMSLLAMFPSFCPLPTGDDPNHRVARYRDILLVSEPTTKAVVGHELKDPM